MATISICRGCGRRFEDPRMWFICPECLRKQDATNGRCCDQAQVTPCVCTRSYTCPTHGESHIGTHD